MKGGFLGCLLLALGLFLGGCGRETPELSKAAVWQDFQNSSPCSSPDSMVQDGLRAFNAGDLPKARELFIQALESDSEDSCAHFGYFLTALLPEISSLYSALAGDGEAKLSLVRSFFEDGYYEARLIAGPSRFLDDLILFRSLKVSRSYQETTNRVLNLLKQSTSHLEEAGRDSNFFFILSRGGYESFMSALGIPSTDSVKREVRFTGRNIPFIQSLIYFELGWLYLSTAYSEAGLEEGVLLKDLDGDGRITLSQRESLPPPPAFILNSADDETHLSGREKLTAARQDLSLGCGGLLNSLESISVQVSAGGAEFPFSSSPLSHQTISRWKEYVETFRRTLEGPTKITYYYSSDFSVSLWLDLSAFFHNAPDDITAWMPTLEAGSGKILSWPDPTLGGTFPNGIPEI